MNNNNHIIPELLKQFQRINPRADFSRTSRSLILTQKPNQKIPTQQKNTLTSLTEYFRQSSFTFIRVSSFVVVGTVIILISFYATRELSPLLLPGLNPQRITAEAQMLDSAMNIELNNLGYFDKSSQESSAVLQQLSQKQLTHLNDTIIKSEVQTLNQISSSTQPSPDLNNLIQQLSK